MSDAFAVWLETTRLAGVIRNSLPITASLSAVHLIGVTLVGGGALLAGLRLSGLIFADMDAASIVRPAGRSILLGLAIAVPTGALLFIPRASGALNNGIFESKMALLGVAVALQFVFQSRATRMDRGAMRVVGLLGSLACFAVIAAGGAFILLE